TVYAATSQTPYKTVDTTWCWAYHGTISLQRCRGAGKTFANLAGEREGEHTMGEVVNCAAYADGQRVADVEVTDLDTVLKQQDCFLWVGLHEPSEALLRLVQQALGLHDLAIEDAHRAHQRPKLERYGNALFVVLRTAQMHEEQGDLQFGETHIFVGPRY